MSTRASALLLTGPVGAGKTTLAVEIGEILREAGQAHAVIELDWLAWCEPPAGSSETRRQLVLENLAATLRNYEAAEIRRFVLAGSIVSSEHLAAIRSTLDGIPLEVVRISAPPDVLVERAEKRDAGRKTLESTDQASAFAATVSAAVPDCVEVENDSADISSTARRVMAQTSWKVLPRID
jgi:adenylylsulfate kinase